MFGVRVPPNTLPLVIYIWIGNIHRDMLLLGIITFTTCHSKQLPVGLMVLSDGMVHLLKIEKIYQNYLVAFKGKARYK